MRVLAIVLLVSAGCFPGVDLDDSATERCTVEPAAPVDVDGSASRFVVDAVTFPASVTEARELGIDLDHDFRPDNAFGNVLASVFGVFDTPVGAKVASEIATGHILHLIEVTSTSLDDADGTGVQLFLGIDRDGDPSDNFSGQEPFGIEAGHRQQPLSGVVIGGRITADRGVVPLRISFPELDQPFVLELDAAQIEAELVDGTLRGRIGGVIAETEVNDTLLPLVHQALASSVEIDCADGACVPGSNGQTFLAAFDDDGDGAISLVEVTESPTVQALIAPDLDLFDEAGDYRPGCDGRNESLSIGLGFTAVPARFQP